MTFNPSDHPRDASGQFSEKLGSAPELTLDSDIIYTNTDVLAYAMDRHGKDWETAADREILVAQYTDEYLAYRENGALDEGLALLEDGTFENYPRKMQDDAVVAVQDAAEDDVETLQKALRLADAAENWNFHETAGWLRNAVQEKVGADPRHMPKYADGSYIWDTESVAVRAAARREAEANLRALAVDAADGGGQDYWEMVNWTAQPERTEGELAAILLRESEDDFYSAVVAHPNATPDMLTYAARHNADAVKWAVAEHPKAPEAALREVEFLATRDFVESQDTQLAWGTMKSYYDAQGERARELLRTIAKARDAR